VFGKHMLHAAGAGHGYTPSSSWGANLSLREFHIQHSYLSMGSSLYPLSDEVGTWLLIGTIRST